MVPMITICEMAFSLGHFPLRIQTAMAISEKPIAFVNIVACSCPKITATISWCLGTRFRTLQTRPLMSQMEARRGVRSLWAVMLVGDLTLASGDAKHIAFKSET